MENYKHILTLSLSQKHLKKNKQQQQQRLSSSTSGTKRKSLNENENERQSKRQPQQPTPEVKHAHDAHQVEATADPPVTGHQPDYLISKGIEMIKKATLEVEKREREIIKTLIPQEEHSKAFKFLDGLSKGLIASNLSRSVNAVTDEEERTKSLLDKHQTIKICDIFYDEGVNRKFVEDNKRIIILLGFFLFRKSPSTKCTQFHVDVKSVNDKKNVARAFTAGNKKEGAKDTVKLCITNLKKKTKYVVPLKGMRPEDAVNMFQSKARGFEAAAKALSNQSSVSLKRAALSDVFQKMIGCNLANPIYYKNGTFWQFKKDKPVDVIYKSNEKKIKLITSSGETHKKSAYLVHNITPKKTPKIDTGKDLFHYPTSFQKTADVLVQKFSNYMFRQKPDHHRRYSKERNTSALAVTSSKIKKKSKRGRFRPSVCDTHAPQKGMEFCDPNKAEMLQHRDVLLAKIDACTNHLLAILGSPLNESTLRNYRQRIRRYYIYAAVMYLINKDNHNWVSSLVFDHHNLRMFLFAHGPDITSRCFLTTFSLLNNQIFKIFPDSIISKTVQTLLNNDYNILGGGKTVTNDVGAPSKTSIHTFTVQSIMSFTGFLLDGLKFLLLKCDDQSKSLGTSTKNHQSIISAINKVCDIFFYTYLGFGWFYRLSAMTSITYYDMLRMILGRPNIHANKSKVAKLVNTRNRAARLGVLNEEEEEDNANYNEGQYDVDDLEERVAKRPSKCVFQSNLVNMNPFLKNLTVGTPNTHSIPMGIQTCLGINLKETNPFLRHFEERKERVGISHYGLSDPNKYEVFLGLDLPLPPPPPTNYGPPFKLFDMVVSDVLEQYYEDSNLVNHMIATVKYRIDELRDAAAEDMRDHNIPRWFNVPYNDPDKLKQFRNKSTFLPKENNNLLVNAHMIEYWKNSPMAEVFLIVKDNKMERFLSLGDMALQCLYFNMVFGQKNWDDKVISVATDMICTFSKRLLMTDHTNFGILGDMKNELKVDLNTGALHNDGISQPSDNIKRDFLNNPLEHRKCLATFHMNQNSATQSHLGRVTAFSWEMRPITRLCRNNASFIISTRRMAAAEHLGHANPENLHSYYSNNFESNDHVNGFPGYIRRALESGRREISRPMTHLSSLSSLSSQKRLQSGFDAISSTLPEVLSVGGPTTSSNFSRVEKMFIKDKYGDVGKFAHSLIRNDMKMLWADHTLKNDAYFMNLKRALSGHKISLICPVTKSLAVAYGSMMFKAPFDDSNNQFWFDFVPGDISLDDFDYCQDMMNLMRNNNHVEDYYETYRKSQMAANKELVLDKDAMDVLSKMSVLKIDNKVHSFLNLFQDEAGDENASSSSAPAAAAYPSTSFESISKKIAKIIDAKIEDPLVPRKLCVDVINKALGGTLKKVLM